MTMLRAIWFSLALAGAPAPGAAQDWTSDDSRRSQRQIAVPSVGLDLSSEAGMDILAARIDHAVNRICASDRRCRDEAWASTEWQVTRAVDRAMAWRRLAQERAAQLRACDRRCSQPAAYYAPPAPATTVIIIR